MKIDFKKFVLKNLEYNGIRNLDLAIKKLEDISEENVEIEENTQISNSYALKKDNTGMLISSDAKMTSILSNSDVEVQLASLNSDSFIEFEFENEEEEELITKIQSDEEILEKLEPYIGPIVEIHIKDVLNVINSNGVLHANGTKQISFDVNIIE